MDFLNLLQLIEVAQETKGSNEEPYETNQVPCLEGKPLMRHEGKHLMAGKNIVVNKYKNGKCNTGKKVFTSTGQEIIQCIPTHLIGNLIIKEMLANV